MPRITGPSIAEHVAAQEAAVVGAARRLFAERGVAAVSLVDIAQEVGLGRTSLYRYFPTKAHILQRWFDQEMDALMDASAAALAGAADPAAAVVAWVDVQLEFITNAEHRALSDAAAGAGELPPDVAAHFGQRHVELYAMLDEVLAEQVPSADLRRHRAVLIGGLISSTAHSLGRETVTAEVARDELRRAALAVAGL